MMHHDVFISYSSKDEAHACQIRNFLQARGIRCWIDEHDLRFTREYDKEIERAIRGSRMLLWLASQHSIASDYVKFEVGTATAHRKRIGPVYLEPLDPLSLPPPFNLKLANVQGIEWFKGSPEDNLQKLARELSLVLHAHRRMCAAWLAAILGVAIFLLAVGLWAVGRSQREPRDAIRSRPDSPVSVVPTGPSPAQVAESGLPSAATPHGAIDILVWDETETTRRGLNVRQSGVMPLRAGDRLRIDAEVDRPMYLYLLWIGSDGAVWPVYPWEGGNWENRPAIETPRTRLSVPPKLDEGLELGGPPGMETFVLLARESPLPRDGQTESWLRGLPLQPQPYQSQLALVEFDVGQVVETSPTLDRGPKSFDPKRLDDPVRHRQQLLAERLGAEFSVLRAISVANQGN